MHPTVSNPFGINAASLGSGMSQGGRSFSGVAPGQPLRPSTEWGSHCFRVLETGETELKLQQGSVGATALPLRGGRFALVMSLAGT